MVGRYVVRLNSWKVRKVKCLLHGVKSLGTTGALASHS